LNIGIDHACHSLQPGFRVFFEENPMKQLALTFILGLTSLSALAGAPQDFVPIPEPGALSLMAIGAVGGLVIWARNRKKK